MCSCGLEPETKLHFFMSYNLYSTLIVEVLSDIDTYAQSLWHYSNHNQLDVLLDGLEELCVSVNKDLTTCWHASLLTTECLNRFWVINFFNKLPSLLLLLCYFHKYTELNKSGIWLLECFVFSSPAVLVLRLFSYCN